MSFPSIDGLSDLAGKIPAPIKISALKVGEHVDVFHRYAQDPNGYFMVKHSTSGILHPSVGKTDGWTTAIVNEAWDIQCFDPNKPQTWVEIRWSHPSWYNRRGHKLDVSKPGMVTQRVLPEQIRQKCDPEKLHRQQPRLTLFHVRWGGEQPVNPVTEGAGGWGQIGATPSDNYINSWENHVFQTIGPTYEIFSAFIQSSEELVKISPPTLRHLLTGRHLSALYFSWPIVFQDGHEIPAYVHSTKLLELMVCMEATGIPTCFPHPSHLYKLFASKEWLPQMCLHPLLQVPLTTMVSRQAVACDPAKAATDALQALAHLAKARVLWAKPGALSSVSQDELAVGRIDHQSADMGVIQKGVAKLGWSWEAMDVTAWKNKLELQRALVSLLEQPGSLLGFVFVQEWINFDVEMRHFVVEPNLSNPQSMKPAKVIYTVFKSRDKSSFHDFERYDRTGCLKLCFSNDDEALADAERQSEELIVRWLQWFQAQTHELPVVIRFDIMATRVGPGRAAIHTGELTELGGCFLGWPEGPSTVFAAMLRSCFREPVIEPLPDEEE